MDFGLSEKQQKWHDAAVEFAREELVDPDSVAREQRGEFWREGYERCGRFGVLGLPVPTAVRRPGGGHPDGRRRDGGRWATAAPTPG